MKIQSTYKELMNIDQDIVFQMNNSPAFSVFNREKIKRFKQENAVRLKILADTVNELMESHVNKDSKGTFKQIVTPEGQPNRWDFISDENAAMFNKDLESFLAKEISIVI